MAFFVNINSIFGPLIFAYLRLIRPEASHYILREMKNTNGKYFELMTFRAVPDLDNNTTLKKNYYKKLTKAGLI